MPSYRHRRATIAAALVLAGNAAILTGCATEPISLLAPQSSPESFGYTERRVSDADYEIVYSGPEVITDNTEESAVALAARKARETTYDLALWRAAQIAAARGYPDFAVTSATTTVKEVIVGHDYRDQGNPVYENVHGASIGYQMAIYFRPTAHIVIELRREKSADSLAALETAQRMQQRYARASNQAIGANTYYYFGPSAIVHASGESGKDYNGP